MGEQDQQALVVPSWRQQDLAALCARTQLMAFDLDTTLARSKTRMSNQMALQFAALTHLRPVAIVSGGRFEQFRDQVLAALPADTNWSQLHLMPTSGTRYYRWDGNDWEQVYAHDLSPEDRMAAMDSLEQRAKELGAWEEHTWGPRLEDRGSQITFSALGQQAPVEAKEAWDPTNERKNALALAVSQDLPHLQVRSGGSTSVDISAKGIDKAYAVGQLARITGVPVAHMMFVGDRMDSDGNDYPAALAGTMALRVSDPDDTLELLGQVESLLKA
ncbi:haloacid dehalogenase [Bombiscardovia apis]|uniref:Haloacid dehalogenase n=1 Tax=Bombiscardovia apis TaxID=2932182 RepID=A0ABM8BC42_9BIFI|nr:HAD-IIB family hydrolase [Bombiscardovia apis]BDR54464.1 haloacid dehalogenase [Bombiscardovia apis]